MRFLATDWNRPTGRFCILGNCNACNACNGCNCLQFSQVVRTTLDNRTTVDRFTNSRRHYQTVHCGPFPARQSPNSETSSKSRTACTTSMPFQIEVPTHRCVGALR